MNNKLKGLFGIALALMLLFSGCAQSSNSNNTGDSAEGKLNIVATTTMLADLAEVIGGGNVSVEGLMGPGVDPHLYQASAGDVTLLQEADVVVYNGLHLEGKMGDVFAALTNPTICIEDGLDPSKLLPWDETDEGGNELHDPHIWFDVTLWMQAAEYVSEEFSEIDPDNAAEYAANYESYLAELEELDTYVRDRIAEIPEDQRYLITAHDAFNYFGTEYGLTVMGLQGISTEAEAGTADMSELADFIVEHQIKAIFVETSVPTKTIEALQAAVEAKGFDVAVGGTLYSDSLGDESSGDETYIDTVKANVDTIVDALK